MTLNTKTLVALAALLYATASVPQDVFKWTDENGAVHFGDSVPDGIENFERVNIAPTPAAAPSPEPAQVAEPAAPSGTEPPPQAPASSTSVVTLQPAGTLTLAELDRLCEDARERAIAPLRAAEIEECKANRRSDPAFCERFFADFGDAGRTTSGTIRPRMFDDLPECVLAQQERSSRGRR